MRNIPGFSDFTKIVGVADPLLERGYSDDVRHILDGDQLRVFEAVYNGRAVAGTP
ncbi:MAG: hypothetical protein JSW71_02300 [Gemmatimonadota bacterium]|nr:MAG: hypothetical protein JSW71_02300 [Gemmatimonadota bacterium]